MFKKILSHTIAALLVIQLAVFLPISPVIAQTVDKNINTTISTSEIDIKESYSNINRNLNDFKKGESGNKQELLEDLDNFIQSEKQKLKTLKVSKEKQNNYLDFLSKRRENILEPKKASPATEKEFKIPENPSRFRFEDEDLKVKKLKLDRQQVFASPEQTEEESSFLASLFSIPDAYAYGLSDYPAIEDLSQTDDEIQITAEIRTLAEELNYNPVNIVNYIKSNIEYEPYYGAKKGSVGCLQEKVCNDIDTASLAIALSRASGIPARYKKAIAVMPTTELKEMLGVDEVKTVYTALAWNKVPVFTISDNPWNGQNLDDADLESETELAVEWTFPEIFYEYDEKGGNLTTILELETISQIETTTDLRTYLSANPDNQWIPIELLFARNHTKTQNEIVSATASFDALTFWENFFQYQGSESPVEKFRQDLISQTGKDIFDAAYQSESTLTENTNESIVLSPSLPYDTASGTDNDGNTILIESWTTLPDDHRDQIVIYLKDADTETVLLTQTFFGTKINNADIVLNYEGATETDKTVIESYGGIYATPAALVDIVPYLLIDGEKITAENTAAIGDSLILGFEYKIKGEIKDTSEKFSVAGNEEGIFITLSQVRENAFLDDPNLDDAKRDSYLLLEGNSALAREYIKQILEESKKLEKALDYTQNLHYARAVITQNRVLNKVDGTPSTFDFKGLTLDANTYITDYSNRGNYKDHRQEYRLLWGQDSSYYEAQTLTDVTGLETIATVQGLQHAYANPGTYTVHKITSANESVIDTLDLSTNTKENMHTDVQAGNTIYTPDKFVQKENWNGLFYVSLDPEWTGTYAIGEQTAQNGAWSVDAATKEEYCYEEEGQTHCEFAYKVVNGAKIYLYEDKKKHMIQCNISETDYNSILTETGYLTEYGLPCYKPTESLWFGDVEHSYKIATNGTQFDSPGRYEYWQAVDEINNLMDTYISQNSISGTRSFRFSKIMGTYMMNISRDKAVYYSPNSSQNHVYLVEGDIFDKLEDDVQKAAKELGYPVGEMDDTAESISGTKGKYQNFIGGQIYLKKTGLDKTYYVPEEIGEYYEHEDNCRMINGNPECGTGGVFGFPLSDPEENGNDIQQKFEEVVLDYNESGDIVTEVALSEEGRRYQNKEYARRQVCLVGLDLPYCGELNGEKELITDVEAFANLANYIAERTSDDEEFVRDITLVLTGSETMRTYAVNAFFDTDSPHNIDGFSDTGFKFNNYTQSYKDSHYCTDTGYNCTSNQLLHSMLGFNHAYFYGKEAGDSRTHKHDDDPSPLGIDGESMQDIWLGMKMSTLGDALKNGSKHRGDVSQWIMSEIADSNYSNMAMSQQEQERTGEYKKKFRIMEYQLNGNVHNKWWYNDDIEKYSCGGSIGDIYYQDYAYIFVNSENVGDAKAIWDESNEKMLLLYWGLKDEYHSESSICDNFNQLIDDHGFSLDHTFTEMRNAAGN